MSKASRERERIRNEKKKQVSLQQGTPDFIDDTPKIGIDDRFSLIMQAFFKDSGMNDFLLSVEAFRKAGAKFITMCSTSQGRGIAFYENSTDKKPLGICIAATNFEF